MAGPLRSEVHVNSVLTNFSIRYPGNQESIICDKMVPPVKVAKSTDYFKVYGKENRRVNTAKAMVPRTGVAPEVTYSMSNVAYTAKSYKLAHPIDADDERDADPAVNMRQDASALLTDNLRLIKEEVAHTLLATVGNWNASNYTTLAAGDVWTDSGGDPIKNIKAAISAIVNATGMPVNQIVMGMAFSTFQELAFHSALRTATGKMYKSNEDMSHLTAKQIAGYFGLKDLYVSYAIKNTENEGNATEAVSYVWDDEVVLLWQPGVPTLRMPTGAACFQFNTLTVKDWFEDSRNSTLVEASESYDVKLTALDGSSKGIGGYVIDNAI